MKKKPPSSWARERAKDYPLMFGADEREALARLLDDVREEISAEYVVKPRPSPYGGQCECDERLSQSDCCSRDWIRCDIALRTRPGIHRGGTRVEAREES